jgi:hypothetical protein
MHRCNNLIWINTSLLENHKLVYFDVKLTKLVVLVTFGHPWVRHSSHLERTMVPTDVVRVSKLAVCPLRLSVRVFTPLPDVRKPKTLVLTFWTLVPESFGNFWKHAPLYNRRFFGSAGGGGRGRFLYSPLGRGEWVAIRPSFLPFGRLQCFVETICTRKSWWSNPRHRLTPVAHYFTGLSLPHPPKPLSQTDRPTQTAPVGCYRLGLVHICADWLTDR